MTRQNRPTDAFGGPPKRNNNVSLVVVLAALAFFGVLQWTARNGGLGTPEPASTVALVATETLAPANAEVAADERDTTSESAPQVDNATPVAASASEAQAANAQTPVATDAPEPTANAPPTDAPTRASALPTIAYADLPPEAHDTIALIDAGGPFPYSRDGLTFQNRERILPRHPEGYYSEYTVITPGSSDRGARRIVAGEGGEMYYTDDHYASFREIMR